MDLMMIHKESNDDFVVYNCDEESCFSLTMQDLLKRKLIGDTIYNCTDGFTPLVEILVEGYTSDINKLVINYSDGLSVVIKTIRNSGSANKITIEFFQNGIPVEEDVAIRGNRGSISFKSLSLLESIDLSEILLYTEDKALKTYFTKSTKVLYRDDLDINSYILTLRVICVNAKTGKRYICVFNYDIRLRILNIFGDLGKGSRALFNV